MAKYPWLQRFPGAVTVCDSNGIILEMNDQAARTYEKEGGYALLGQNLFECHSPNSQQTLKTLMEQQQVNVYTIQKNGLKKLIYQTPWYDEDGAYAGFVEVSLVLPENMPHFIRG